MLSAAHTARVRGIRLRPTSCWRIFDLLRSGWGLKRILPSFSLRRARNQALREKGRIGAWQRIGPIYAVRSSRERCIAASSYGTRQKRKPMGQKAPRPTPPPPPHPKPQESEWIRAEVSDLRSLTKNYGSGFRLDERNARLSPTLAGGSAVGRPTQARNAESVSGLANCGICGGVLVVESGGKKGVSDFRVSVPRHRAMAHLKRSPHFRSRR
jgi:hypothetical protein